MRKDETEPCYVISVAAGILGVGTHTLRHYEKMGLVEPSRTGGNIRLYSVQDIERLRKVKTFMDELGVNLAGIDVILRMSENIARMEEQIQSMEKEIERLRRRGSF
ncbi:MAG: MerR family transcriptional regulator [Chloroflexi bacterium]|jgi:MerR family transcriptional regulator, heat shock protein HspR|nr:MerR family transcriptional regulator [Chloroflexota bacterium]MBT7080346.1 MerR family transcriptional regulator [Chloroflexota bacterium]MBT7290365.1 MerR family transcriptional regulator [Chloroflexota bacterium]